VAESHVRRQILRVDRRTKEYKAQQRQLKLQKQALARKAQKTRVDRRTKVYKQQQQKKKAAGKKPDKSAMRKWQPLKCRIPANLVLEHQREYALIKVSNL